MESRLVVWVLRIRVTAVVLKTEGTTPVEREEWIMTEMTAAEATQKRGCAHLHQQTFRPPFTWFPDYYQSIFPDYRVEPICNCENTGGVYVPLC